MRIIKLNVNGQIYELDIKDSKTLLEVVREDLNLTGAKFGCGSGECGGCTMLIDGKPILSCLTLALEADGKKVMTIEGMAQGGELHPIQQAYIDEFAVQCGYCTSGLIMITKALLDENPNPTEEEVKDFIKGNLCRCTGYVKIVKAVLKAADVMRRSG